MKYANLDGNLRWTGGMTLLHKGDSFDDDHPIVLERPELFGDEAPSAMFRTDDVRRVESTMASGPAGVRVEKPVIVKAAPRSSQGRA